MVAEDQKALFSGKLDLSMFERHAERLKEIIKKFGWPGETLVGREAADRAWLLVQHAEHDIEFQKAALKILRKAAREGETEKRQVAYLTDRVLVNTGRPQLFGTQFYTNIFKPRPIKNRQYLNRRRRRYGLEPFEEYARQLRMMRKTYQRHQKNKSGSF